MTTYNYPQVIFPEGFDERNAFELQSKGWIDVDIMIDTHRYTISFIDPIRLRQDLDEHFSSGGMYFAEPNLVILPELTVETIRKASHALSTQGFFSQLK